MKAPSPNTTEIMHHTHGALDLQYQIGADTAYCLPSHTTPHHHHHHHSFTPALHSVTPPSPVRSPSHLHPARSNPDMGNVSSLRRRRSRPDDAALLYTKPSGLYATCAWDDKHVGRLILRGELAPRHPGRDDRSDAAPEECPICMLNYPALNATRCCSARLCTECYLQIRPPRHSKEPCPFCKHRRLDAAFRGARDAEELAREAADEQRATAAMRRAQAAAAAATPDLQPAALNALRSTHSDGAFSSSASTGAASAAAQAGNSAASAASSESVALDLERPSVDVATMRRFPFGSEGFPQFTMAASGAEGSSAFGHEQPESGATDRTGRTCMYAGPVVCRFSDEFSEAIRRSLLEQ